MPLSPEIQSYVEQHLLTFEQAIRLNYNERANLESEAIRGLIAGGVLTIERAIRLDYSGRRNLESEVIRDMIADETLTFEMAIGLDGVGRRNLESEAIRGLIADGALTIERAISLDYNRRNNLESEAIRGLIADGVLTIELAMILDVTAILKLESEFIRGLIADETLTLEQATRLDNNGRNNLESEAIRGLIADETLTLEQGIRLDYNGRNNLESEAIRGLIADGVLTLEEALEVNHVSLLNLESEAIRGLIADGVLTVERAMALDFTAILNLESEAIRGLIADETLTIEQAMRLDYTGRIALEDEHTRQRLRDGELRVENFMAAGVILPQGVQDIPAPVNINDSQSTHTASVHRTVSESAARLLNRYATVLNPLVLDEIIITIISAIDSLPNDNEHNEAAKRCVTRLTAPEYLYTDVNSGVSTRQLLAISWLAIHDDTVRTGSIKDATYQFIEGLYEIQRGYNISETGIDLHGLDNSICSAGTFNKLIEKLNGLHPDVVIEVITPQISALKLPIVIKEEVQNYLAAKANPTTLSDFVQFIHHIAQIEQDGIEIIWDVIKDIVAARMFDEFGVLYANQDDPRFTAFVDAGKYAELGQLPSFQKELSQSEGSRKYYSATMKSYRMFSKPQFQDSRDIAHDNDFNALRL